MNTRFTKSLFGLVLALLLPYLSFAQAPKVYTSSDIYEGLQKLNFLGSMLYVAAHPDDENTRLISYYANEVKAKTAYLSLTRGDGGQNLIGSEIKELLGVMRTEELMAARRLDGGEQMFGRANDFGFSKNAEETREIWEEEKVMSDVVWAIRKHRPDVIINRFDHTTSGRTHGHHTASAILSYEAFDISGDKNQFPEQLEYAEPWQAERLMFNTSWWFYGSREKFAEVDKSDMVMVDVGVYYPLKGKSNTEIAAESRSKHVCQGMGNTASRGSREEYIQLLKGSMPANQSDIFAGINTTWSRVKGGGHATRLINNALSSFDFTKPHRSIPALVEIYQFIEQLPSSFWRDTKLAEAKELLEATTGLYLEARTNEHTYTPGEYMDLTIECTNRSAADIQIKHINYLGAAKDTSLQMVLNDNESKTFKTQLQVPVDTELTAPYWLREPGSLGMYKVDDQRLVGLPRTDRALKAEFLVSINGVEIDITKDIVYRYNDPESGPVYRPLEIVSPLSVRMSEKVYILSNERPQEVTVVVKALSKNQKGTVSLPVSGDWNVTPAQYDFDIKYKGADQAFTFIITPPKGQSEIKLEPVVKSLGRTYTKEMISIDYPHIPYQSVALPAEAKMVKLDIKTAGKKIAYVQGSGDAVPKSLEQIGYQVDILEVEDITPDRLKNYDALVLGIRAYNKLEGLKYKQELMHEYVFNGGNMVVQYNTNRRLKVDEVGPFPLELSRERVTVEEAPVSILVPNHPVMNYPNKITQKDFEGWVQERGLYFATTWDDNYKAILACNDPGEPARKGGLLVAPYGDGRFIMTGYSWFRQLPAGVPGAYRIFANLVSSQRNIKP